MQYVVIGLDGTDEGAAARRQAVRADHIARGDELVASGNLWYAAALLHEDGPLKGTMKGSMYVVHFDTQAEFENWYASEPHVTDDVWRESTVHTSSTRNPWQFNREESWFEGLDS